MDNNKLKMEQQMNLKLKDIGLGGKVTNYYFNKFGCETVRDLFKLSREELFSISSAKGYGYAYLDILLVRMRELNLRFNWEEEYFLNLKERVDNEEIIELSKFCFSNLFLKVFARKGITNSYLLIKNYEKNLYFFDDFKFNDWDNKLLYYMFGIEKVKGTIVAHDENVDNILIEKLEFSIRANNLLRRAGIKTLGDLLKCSVIDIYQIRNITLGCAKEIITKVHFFGYKFNGFSAITAAELSI